VDGAAIGRFAGRDLDLGGAIVGELGTQQPLQARSDVLAHDHPLVTPTKW
jgi:hypothetical protein